MSDMVRRLRAALHECQTRLVRTEDQLRRMNESLEESMEAVLAAAQEMAPLSRLAACIDEIDRLQKDDPFGDDTDSRLLALIESRDKGLRFYRESRDPERAQRLKQHVRRLALQLAATELESAGTPDCLGAAARLRRASETSAAYRIQANRAETQRETPPVPPSPPSAPVGAVSARRYRNKVRVCV